VRHAPADMICEVIVLAPTDLVSGDETPGSGARGM